ncbi:MAG: DHH family phosphoesterase [Candidatus Micrarchaeota archaeon]
MRYNYGKKEYTITDGKIEQFVKSDEPLTHGACVKIEGELDNNGTIIAKKVHVLNEEKTTAIYGKIRDNVTATLNISNIPTLVNDEITKKIWPQLREIAIELNIATKLGRSVLLRFHGDADGVCGAFAITNIIYCKAFQQNSAMYGVKDAFRDISTIGQENKPLIILLDFGSSDGCKEALELITAAGIEYIVVDHHPYQNQGNKKIVNPFAFGENVSKYTAGYLACEIAIACGFSVEKARGLAKIACSGDKSDILQSDENDAKKAMVLDFLTNHVSFGNNLDFYKKVMDNQELFTSIVQQANDSIEEAAGKALAGAKRINENGVEICVFPLENIVRKGEWPSSSKITTRVFDKLRTELPLMCIGYTEYSIIMRINDAGVTKGLNANILAENMKKTMGDFIKGGGGHPKAGAISVRPAFVKDVLSELQKLITATVNQ